MEGPAGRPLAGAARARAAPGRLCYGRRLTRAGAHLQVRGRVLSLANETGHWEYFVVGPAEAKADGERQHPWWPESEQFIDFVSVRLADAELAEEVARLRAGAAARYDPENAARPWPITFAKHMRSKAGFTQRTDEEYGTQKLAEAEDHNTRLAAEVRQEQHSDELIYMFRRLATLFLEV